MLGPPSPSSEHSGTSQRDTARPAEEKRWEKIKTVPPPDSEDARRGRPKIKTMSALYLMYQIYYGAPE